MSEQQAFGPLGEPLDGFPEKKDDRISLNWSECLLCTQVGVMWELSAMFGSRGGDRYVDGKTPWKAHIEGAAAEYAAAKYLDRHWACVVFNPKDKFEFVPDVGPWQVRQAEQHNYRLTLRVGKDQQKPNVPFILVTGMMPEYRVRGWKYGRDVMLDRYWSDPNEKGFAWWFPIPELEPMETLPGWKR